MQFDLFLLLLLCTALHRRRLHCSPHTHTNTYHPISDTELEREWFNQFGSTIVASLTFFRHSLLSFRFPSLFSTKSTATYLLFSHHGNRVSDITTKNNTRDIWSERGKNKKNSRSSKDIGTLKQLSFHTNLLKDFVCLCLCMAVYLLLLYSFLSEIFAIQNALYRFSLSSCISLLKLSDGNITQWRIFSAFRRKFLFIFCLVICLYRFGIPLQISSIFSIFPWILYFYSEKILKERLLDVCHTK